MFAGKKYTPKAPPKNKTNDTAHCNPRYKCYTNRGLGRKGKGDNSAAIVAVDSAAIMAVDSATMVAVESSSIIGAV